MTRTILLLAAAMGLATAALAQPPAAAPAKPPPPAAAAGSPELAEGPGKAMVQASCANCHGIDVITNQPRSRDEWVDVVSRMIGNGAQLGDDEYNPVIDYLAKYYGPAK
jgi:cytochrome c5